MRIVRAAILGMAGLLLGGCFGDSSSDGEPSLNPTDPTSGNGAPTTPPPAASAFKALYQPSAGVLPYPIDLFFSGTTDGTLNLPITSFNSTAAAINTLDGFSTTADIRVRFSGPLNPASVTPANIRVFRLVLSNTTKAPLLPPAPGGALPQPRTVGTGTDTAADFNMSIAQEQGGEATLILRPNRPLEPSTGATNIGYLVLLTSGFQAAATGNTPASADTEFAIARNQAIAELGAGATTPSCAPITNPTLRSICQLTFAHLAIGAQGFGQTPVAPTSVVVSFSFSTQSIGDTLGAVAQIIAASPPPAIAALSPMGTGPSGNLTTRDIIGTASPGLANVHLGTVRIPYYLTAPSTAAPTAPLSRFWTAAGPSPAPGIDPASRNLTRFNPVPAKTADLDIPLVVTVPNANAGPAGVQPPTGWPVVIFQHGLTRNRFDLLGVADAFASQGIVVVSIDIPLHGVGPTSTLAAFRQVGRERTFDLDASNNTTLAPQPDGVVDGSGQNFVNLGSLLTTRDNLRQAAADLLALTRALPSLDLADATAPDIDPGRIHFVGHSLGSIVGGVYATVGANVRTASLLMTGGGVANTINDSVAFGPSIRAGLLAASGGLLQPGTTLFNQFLRDAQTATDSGDPLNYIHGLLATKPVHITQIVGGPPNWPSDLVVPNSSTQRLIRTGGPLIRQIASTSPVAPNNGAFVNFVAGHHGSIIDRTCGTPAVNTDEPRCQAVNAEMRGQVISLVISNGVGASAVQINDTSVIQPP